MAGTLLERHALITRADPILHMPVGCQLQEHPSMPSASSLLFLLWLFFVRQNNELSKIKSESEIKIYFQQ